MTDSSVKLLRTANFFRQLLKLGNNMPKQQTKFNDVNTNFIKKNLVSATLLDSSNLHDKVSDKVSVGNDDTGINSNNNVASSKLNFYNTKSIYDTQLINKVYDLLAKTQQISFSRVPNDIHLVHELQDTLQQLTELLFSPNEVLGVPLISNKDIINSFNDVFMNINTEVNNNNLELSQRLFINLRDNLNAIGTKILKQYEELVYTQEIQEMHALLIQLVNESYESGYKGKIDLANKYDMQPLMFTRKGNSWYGLKSMLQFFKRHYYVKQQMHHGINFKVFTGEPLYGLKVDSYIMRDSGDLVLSVAGTSMNIYDLVDDASIALNRGMLSKSKPTNQFIDTLVSEWKSATEGLNIDKPQSFIVGHSLGSRVGAYMMAYLAKKYNFNVCLSTFEDPGGHSHMLAKQLKLSQEDPYIKKDYKEKITVVNSKVNNPINELHSLAGINQYQYWNSSSTVHTQSLLKFVYSKKWLIKQVLDDMLKSFKSFFPHKFISDQDLYSSTSYIFDRIASISRKLSDKLNINSHTVERLQDDIATGILLQKITEDKFKVTSKNLFDLIKQKITEFNSKHKQLHLHNASYQYHSEDIITLLYEDSSLSIDREDFLQLIQDNYTQILQYLRSSYSNALELLCALENKFQNSTQDIILDSNIEADNNTVTSYKLENSDLLGCTSPSAVEAA